MLAVELETGEAFHGWASIVPESRPPQRRRSSDVERVDAPRDEEQRPLRPADPFRVITNQLAVSSEVGRRVIDESGGVVDRRALEPIGADLRAILSKAIDHISRAQAGPGQDLLNLRDPARGVEMSALRGIVVSEELATLMDMPAGGIEDALREVLHEGRLELGKRADVVDLLRTLRSTVAEAMQNEDGQLIVLLVPHVLQVALLLGLEGAAASLAALAVSESVATEVTKALVILLVLRAGNNAQKVVRDRRVRFDSRTTSRLAHNQLFRDLRKYDISIRDQPSIDDSLVKARAAARLQIVINIAIVKKNTLEQTWPGKSDYWSVLDELQDWVEGRGGLTAVYGRLENSKPPWVLHLFRRGGRGIVSRRST